MKNFQTFLTEKGISKEDFAKKSAEEMAGLYNEFNDVARKELEAAIESKASTADIEALKTELKNNQTEQMKSLNETLKQYGLAIKKLSTNSNEEATVVSIKDNLKKNIDKLKALKGDDKGGVEGAQFSFKAAADMTHGNVSGGNVPVEQRLSGMNPIASRRVRLMDIVTRGVATSNIISWVYQANKDGAAGGTTEGATKNQIDFDLVVASQTVKKRTAFIKISTEMLEDVDFIQSEIQNELLRELLKDIESQVYSGDNLSNNLNGIRTVATAFAAGTFAGTVDNANEADVLTVAANQIKIANQDAPNFILMHPSDVTKLKLYKVSTTDKRYIDRLVFIAGQMSLDGIPIIETTLVTAGQYLIGDFSKAFVYDKGEVSINVGLDGNDFTKNMRTVIAEWRGLAIVKNNDRTAFVKGVFATDAAALETT